MIQRRLKVDNRVNNIINKVVYGVIILSSTCTFAENKVNNDEAIFNDSFFSYGKSKLDISRFDKKESLIPGQYLVDVYINNISHGRRQILIKEDSLGKGYVCASYDELAQYGINFDKGTGNDSLKSSSCEELSKTKMVAFDFNPGELRLDITVPQKYMKVVPRGYVPPSSWDYGAPLIGFYNYDANVYRLDNDFSGKSEQYYLSSNAGLNLNEWRFRYNSVFTSYNNEINSGHNYQNTSSYVQRDLDSILSTLTVGDYFTPSTLFDSIPFRGIMIASEDKMLPDSMRGYAPSVRGVAETNAKVSIRQNGNLIYETVVTPGEFSIDDLYNTSTAGDLEVTIQESSGRVKKYIVPFASIPNMLRDGQSKFSVMAGELRDRTINNDIKLLQATYLYGVNDSSTVYTGGIAADKYISGVLGYGINTILGAFSVDLTQSVARDLECYSGSVCHKNMNGQSYRLTYSKLAEETNTNITFSAYRYSTENYLDFKSFAELKDDSGLVYRAKNKFQLNLNQPFSDGFGNAYTSISTQDYWNESGRNTSYMLGYNNNFRWVDYSITLSRIKNQNGNDENQFGLSLSLPFGTGINSPRLTSSYINDSDGNSNTSLNLSGTTGELNNFNYNLNGSRYNGDNSSSSIGGNIQYSPSFATFIAGASKNSTSSQLNGGVSGALVFHPGGVTPSQSLGDSFAVIEAPMATGAELQNTNGTVINGLGYAVAASLNPYRSNEINILPKGMSDNVELETTSQQVSPRNGAIPVLKFKTKYGQPVLLTISNNIGEPIPLGSNIVDSRNNFVTVSGQGGKVFMRGNVGEKLTAVWGRSPSEKCNFKYEAYDIKPLSKSKVNKVKVICR